MSSYVCQKGWLLYGMKCFYLIKIKTTNNSAICNGYGKIHRLTSWTFHMYKFLYEYTYFLIKSHCFYFDQYELGSYIKTIHLTYLPETSALLQTLLNKVELYRTPNKKCTDIRWIYCYETAQTATTIDKPYLANCSSGELILQEFVCDGEVDCISEEDEDICPSICFYKNGSQKTDCLSCLLDNCFCDIHYFQCQSGGCIHISKVCDKTEDCPDGMCSGPVFLW